MKELTMFGLMVGAIVTTGLVLDAAGNGLLGSTVKNIAGRVTSGYGE